MDTLWDILGTFYILGRRTNEADPRDLDTLSTYDKLGRVTQKDEDDRGSKERITTYPYNGLGSMTSPAAPGADLSTELLLLLFLILLLLLLLLVRRRSSGICRPGALRRGPDAAVSTRRRVG